MEVEPIVDLPVPSINIHGEDFLLCASSDKIDYFPGRGAFILKILTQDQGMVGFAIAEDLANDISEKTDIPIAIRMKMSQTEYDGFLTFLDANLDEEWLL